MAGWRHAVVAGRYLAGDAGQLARTRIDLRGRLAGWHLRNPVTRVDRCKAGCTRCGHLHACAVHLGLDGRTRGDPQVAAPVGCGSRGPRIRVRTVDRRRCGDPWHGLAPAHLRPVVPHPVAAVVGTRVRAGTHRLQRTADHAGSRSGGPGRQSRASQAVARHAGLAGTGVRVARGVLVGRTVAGGCGADRAPPVGAGGDRSLRQHRNRRRRLATRGWQPRAVAALAGRAMARAGRLARRAFAAPAIERLVVDQRSCARCRRWSFRTAWPRRPHRQTGRTPYFPGRDPGAASGQRLAG